MLRFNALLMVGSSSALVVHPLVGSRASTPVMAVWDMPPPAGFTWAVEAVPVDVKALKAEGAAVVERRAAMTTALAEKMASLTPPVDIEALKAEGAAVVERRATMMAALAEKMASLTPPVEAH